MRALVVGASGRTGRLVVDELLEQGHGVTALIRNPNAENKPRTGLSIVKGSPTSLADVRQAFAQGKPDVVIVTLSAPRASDSPFAEVVAPPRLMADSNANVVAAMKEFGVPKVVILQAFGVGDSWPNMHCVLRLLMGKSNMSYQYDDHNAVDKEVRTSDVGFVLVRPVRLVEGEAREVKVWPNAGKGVPLMASITRQSVANWLVKAAESSEWDNSSPVIAN